VKIRFTNCTLADPAEKPVAKAPIVFNSRKEQSDDIGGVEFAGLTIREKTDRPLMKFYNASRCRVRNLSGSLTVELNGKRTDYVVDQALVDRLMPVRTKPKKK
jgi:hypothetical protein